MVGFCVVVLFWGVTYRTTRSSYARWWCVSLTLFLVSATLFLFNGTSAQVVANPLGNTLAVAGATGVWVAARSLRGGTVPTWQLAALPGPVLVASFVDDPANDIWSGGAFYLAGMAIALGLSTLELTASLRQPVLPGADRPQMRFAVTSLAVVSGLMAVFYALRTIAFVVVGPDGEIFRTAFGSPATTLLTMVLLVVVTFSMSELSHEQQTSELREQATHDGLTGLLNRSEFLRRADDVFAAGGSGVLMVADLDGFKTLNDTRGHAAGDRALICFASACRAVTEGDGLVGRLGGDEFALLLTDGDRAEETADRISQLFVASANVGVDSGELTPTISFGIAPVDAAVGVKDTIVRADVALYQAKAAGRDRVFRYDGATGAL